MTVAQERYNIAGAPAPYGSSVAGVVPMTLDGGGNPQPVSSANPLIVSSGDTPLASIIDSTTTAGYVYFLQAQPGTSTATQAWQVSRLQKSNSQVTWANGNANYSNYGTGYAALTYL